jgi:conjugative relaxase-like TrwC/TraI family protein
MLSSSVIKNVGQANHYYSEKDNYYTRDEGVEKSEWWGKGAKSLNLSGVVDEKQFSNLLQGRMPNGELLGKMVDGQLKHRAGWDLTFSAPKSISILAYVGGDMRLVDAHRNAVSIALSHIEHGCAQARISSSEGMKYQNTGNLVGALYHHDLSRARDPQMHTHSVIMNMTKRLDGKWRSLASKMGRYDEKSIVEVNGFIERVRNNNRYLSKVYETELAFQVKKLGYEITTKTKSGIFEIADVPGEVINFFSKRRNEIENQLVEKGLSGGKASAIATLDTRDTKKIVDRQELQEEWKENIRKLKFDVQSVVRNSERSLNSHEKNLLSLDIDINPKSALDKAALSLSVFRTTFSIEDLVCEASDYAVIHAINIDSLLLGISKQIENGDLISLPEKNGKTALMAKSTLDDEKRMFANFKNNILEVNLIDTNHLANYIAQHAEITPALSKPLCKS